MFDFGFSELMFIAVIALLVVGPQRLPKVARTAGHLLGRARRYVAEVKSEISREMQLEELKELQQQVQKQASELATSVRKEVDGFESDMKRTAAEIEHDVASAPASDESGDNRLASPGKPAQVTDAHPVPLEGATSRPARGEPAGAERKSEPAEQDKESQLQSGLDPDGRKAPSDEKKR